MPREDVRRDSKNRVLWHGEAQRPDGKYVFKYWVEGKQKTLISWRLVPEDYQPPRTKPTLSLREIEKNIGRDMESIIDPIRQSMTVKECVERYLKTEVGVKTSTKSNYKTIMNTLKKQAFYYRRIHEIRTSDAKLFLIKLQQEDGMHWSKIKSTRGVLRPAFQMAVDDDNVYCKYYEAVYILFHTGDS